LIFSFTDAGITLKDTDPYSKQEISLYTPESHNLRKYAAISKNTNLNSLFSYEAQQPLSDRNFYLNYPEQLPKKALQYEFSEDGEYLATQNLQDNFINIDGAIWEKARTYKNLSIYQRLPQITNPYFIEKIAAQINTKVNVKQFEGLVKTLENIAEIERTYTQEQLSTINQERQCQ